MDIYGVVVMSVFAILAAVGMIGTYLSSQIIRILIKHRKDNAPLTAFLLNPESSKHEIKWFLFPAVTVLLTGVFTLAQKLLGPISFTNPLIAGTFLLAYIFGILTAILVVYVVYRWYKKMKRFA